MVYCRSCGKPMLGIALECDDCVAKQVVTDSRPKAVAQGSRASPFWFLFLCLLCGGFLLTFHVVPSVLVVFPKQHPSLADTFIDVPDFIARYNKEGLLERLRGDHEYIAARLEDRGLIKSRERDESKSNTNPGSSGERTDGVKADDKRSESGDGNLSRPSSTAASESPASTSATEPRFEDHPAPYKFSGPIKLPEGLSRDGDGMWRNEHGKRVDPPEINFSGKYLILLNSCGMSCSYYTMTDLETGAGLSTLSPFAHGEDPPKTKDGFPYFAQLIFRENSNMMVAQYHVTTNVGEECRQRVFLFEDGKIKPITPTRTGCPVY